MFVVCDRVCTVKDLLLSREFVENVMVQIVDIIVFACQDDPV